VITQPIIVDVSAETDRAEPGRILASLFGVPVARFEDIGDDRVYYFHFETEDDADQAARVIEIMQRPLHAHAIVTMERPGHA
jgi:hypothetical protein